VATEPTPQKPDSTPAPAAAAQPDPPAPATPRTPAKTAHKRTATAPKAASARRRTAAKPSATPTKPAATPKPKAAPAAERPAPSAKAGSADADRAVERIRETNERILEQGREWGLGFLDAYEQTLNAFADYQTKAADRAGAEWVSQIARAQADFLRKVTEVSSSTARRLLK
jgi:hypothetical protein